MSIFTRDELLRLRESPLIASSSPDLPPWISSEAIEKAQKEPRASARLAGPTTNKTGESGDNDGFILREPRTKRDSRDKDARGSADRLFERRNPLSKEDRGFDKNDVFKSLREPRRPDVGEENFASRRSLKKGSAQTIRETREPAWAQETKTSAAATESSKDKDDDPSGKTIDDFERWKASMRKAEGLEAGAHASETVLPPLQASQNLQTSPAPAKDVKVPPGFTPAMASAEDGEALMNKLFAAGGEVSNVASPEKQPRASPPQAVSSGGSSKFSKFFSASSVTVPRTEAKPLQSARQLDGITAAEVGGDRKPKNKDDVEGLERILAMLSSSQGQQKSGNAVQQTQSRPPQEASGASDKTFASWGNNPAQPLRGQGMPDHSGSSPYPQYGDRSAMLNMFASDGMRMPQAHPTSPQKDRSTAAYLPDHEHLRYAQGPPPPPGVGFGGPPLRQPQQQQGHPMAMHNYMAPPPMSMQAKPAIRDGTSGADSILGHHAQNQDFFSSLLSQAGPLQPQYPVQPQQQHQQQRMGGPTSPLNTMAGVAGRPLQSREEVAYMQHLMREQPHGQSRRYEGPGAQAVQSQAGQSPLPQAWSLDSRIPPSSGPAQPYR